MSGKANIVFMGTPEFAVPSLRSLVENGYRVSAVVTQPDRPVGRKKILTPTPVKAEAERLGIPVLQPAKLRAADAVQELASYKPDLIVTAAYGQLLPKAVLELPPRGCINVHGSLLPKYRGGAPIQRAIMNGERVTGVTLMYMAEGLDTGDMIAKAEVAIGEDDDAGVMFDKLAQAGAKLLSAQLPAVLDGTAPRTAQNDAEATYAPNLTREDERIDWSRPAVQLYNQLRGLSPQPGTFTYLRGNVFKIWKAARPAPGRNTDAAPGTVLAVDREGIHIATGEGIYVAAVVQPAGKKAMPAVEFAKGGLLKPGERLGETTDGSTGEQAGGTAPSGLPSGPGAEQ